MRSMQRILGTNDGGQAGTQAKTKRGMAMQKADCGYRTLFRMFGLVLLASLAWPLSARAVTCDDRWETHTNIINYLEFAKANGWVEEELVVGSNNVIVATNYTYLSGYGPGEDIDEDGLTNSQEFNGYSAMVNGRLQWFTWNGLKTASSNEWGGCGPDPETFDTDCDGISDYYEYRFTITNPQSPDTDGDGLWDAIEVFAGLSAVNSGWTAYTNGLPAPGARPTGENPWMDPDGDGLDTAEELPSDEVITACATVENPFPFEALTNAVWTSPLDYDTDDDRLIDSFERKYSKKFNPTNAEPDPRSYDADFDSDGLVNFREQCMHPLLANYYSSMTRTDPPTPFDTF